MKKNHFLSFFCFSIFLNFLIGKNNLSCSIPLLKPTKNYCDGFWNKKQGIFSWSYSKFLDTNDFLQNGVPKKFYTWEANVKKAFTELIFSWNALRPKQGKYAFWVSLKYDDVWSNWYKLAEWGTNFQQTFVCTKNPYVHVTHSKTQMQKGKKSTGFRVMVQAEQGADLQNVKAFFATMSDMDQFRVEESNFDLPSVCVKGVYAQSQMIVDHIRHKDLCSPTSTCMLMKSFAPYSIKKLKDFIPEFAEKVHDNSYLDIYGNWILNVAQAFDSLDGQVYFMVKRLNGFKYLYDNYLKNQIPVAVSVRGYLPGGVKSYDNGHFIVIVGWDNQNKKVLCIDSAFPNNRKTLKKYDIKHFLNAWGTSRNLSYIPQIF